METVIYNKEELVFRGTFFLYCIVIILDSKLFHNTKMGRKEVLYFFDARYIFIVHVR